MAIESEINSESSNICTPEITGGIVCPNMDKWLRRIRNMSDEKNFIRV
jgi:hypothetical protein